MAFGDVVQSNSGTGTTATVAPTLPGATTAGNLVVLTFAADDYNASPNAGWTQSSEMEQQTFHGGYLWWAKATAGMTIPSYTIGSAVRSAWTLVEYAGPFDASPYDVSEGQFQQSSSSSYTTANMTPTSGDRLMVASLLAQMGGIDIGSWQNITNSFTQSAAVLFNSGNPCLSIVQLRRIVTANGSTAYSTGGDHLNGATQVSQSRSALIIAFKAGAGGGAATGTLSATLGAATAAATGKVLASGTSAVTLGAATGTITGKVTVAGSYVGTLFPAMLSATGTVSALGATGTLTTTLGNATLAATGVVTTPNRTGTLNVTLQDATLYAISMPQRYATLDVSLGEATLLARGHVPAWWTRAAPPSAIWQTPPTPPFIRVTMESVGGDRIRITEDGAIRIIAYELVGPWRRADFADAVWTKE